MTSYLRVTLVQQHAVDALRVHATRTFVGGLAVAAGDLREVGAEDLNLSDGAIHLSGWRKTVDIFKGRLKTYLFNLVFN